MKKIFYVLIAVIIGAGLFFYEKESLGAPKAETEAWRALRRSLVNKARQFKGTPAFVIIDLKHGWEATYNKSSVIASASLVKIPIMACCYDDIANGRLSISKKIKLLSRHITSGSGKLKYQKPGTYVTIGRLIELMITESDNTATNILIDVLGYKHLNAYFKKIGLKHTNLSRKMMDMASRKKGIENYTTAYDMALVLDKIYNGKLGKSVSFNCLNMLKKQKMKDRLPKLLPAKTVVAHKTGLENHICHDVGIIFTANGDFVIAALTKHNNKYAALSKKFISQLALMSYNYYSSLK